MKKTIFISSTYKDLVKERKAVWELLKRYDVNIVGMEEFGARKDSTLTTCLKEVEQSNIYIGIIANRWGSIEEESGKSYTQLEYEKAIEKDKEILIYLIDETASVQIDNIDFGEKHESLELFKKELQKNHTIDRFINATDLVEKLERKIDSLIGQYKYPSNSAEFKDKMEESKYYFERFQLTPKLYVNKEVILKIKKDGRLFPLSKICCDTFKFTYGATVAVKIKILEPLIADTITNTLVIESNNQDFMWTIENDKEYTILSQLLFTDNNVKNEEAYFKDTVFSCISIRDIKTDTVWKSGEGKAILLLKELITE